MFVKFDNEFYWVKSSYTLTAPASKTSKKRKQSEETIYILKDVLSCYTRYDEIAVKSSDCEEVDGLCSSLEELINEFLEKNFSNDEKTYLKCSYKTNPKKEYYISSIDKIMTDGMIVSLHNGDIRHFKFDKIYIACGDGLTTEYY